MSVREPTEDLTTTASQEFTIGVVDSAVHPQVRHPDEIREYMREPWRSKPFAGPDRPYYPNPVGDYLKEAQGPTGLPGSDPNLFDEWLFQNHLVEFAILLPLTRGLQPDVDLDSAICAATNDWLADTWLSRYNVHKRYRGSIRVCPREPEKAVREIERWAGHPYMVQVAVPLQAQHPYGQRMYFPIWQTAAKHNLPVVVHQDAGYGVDFWPSAAGYPRHFIEYSVLFPLNFAYHMSSLITEGTFDRLKNLRFVFADGGHDVLPSLMYRLDLNWRSSHQELVWTANTPTSYLVQHMRFCSHALEGPDDPEVLAKWLEIGDAYHLLLFSSNYPQWDCMEPSAAAFGSVPESQRSQIMRQNALEWYGLSAPPVEPVHVVKI
jgi:predicted TIM-barrel fold metal-dependent hydrolase